MLSASPLKLEQEDTLENGYPPCYLNLDSAAEKRGKSSKISNKQQSELVFGFGSREMTTPGMTEP